MNPQLKQVSNICREIAEVIEECNRHALPVPQDVVRILEQDIPELLVDVEKLIIKEYKIVQGK